MKKTIPLLLSIIFIFSGCSVYEYGDDLCAFNSRINQINKDYNITADGYITDSEESTEYRFFKFGSDELLLSFTSNEKGKIKEMNIACENAAINNSECIAFIKNALISFVNDENALSQLIDLSKLTNILNENMLYTKETESGNTTLKLDVTAVGTVVSVYKDL